MEASVLLVVTLLCELGFVCMCVHAGVCGCACMGGGGSISFAFI